MAQDLDLGIISYLTIPELEKPLRFNKTYQTKTIYLIFNNGKILRIDNAQITKLKDHSVIISNHNSLITLRNIRVNGSFLRKFSSSFS